MQSRFVCTHANWKLYLLTFFYQFPWQLILFEVKPLHNDFEFGQFIIVPLTSFFCGLGYCNMWTLFNCKRFGCLNSITLLIMLPNAGHSQGLISKGHFFRFLCLFCIIFSCLHTSICVGFILKSITLKKKSDIVLLHPFSGWFIKCRWC